jgi:hypothetical protein
LGKVLLHFEEVVGDVEDDGGAVPAKLTAVAIAESEEGASGVTFRKRWRVRRRLVYKAMSWNLLQGRR